MGRYVMIMMLMTLYVDEGMHMSCGDRCSAGDRMGLESTSRFISRARRDEGRHGSRPGVTFKP